MVDDDGILRTVPLIPRRTHHDVVGYEHTVAVYSVVTVVDWYHYYYSRMKPMCLYRSGSTLEWSCKLAQRSTTGTETWTNISTNHVPVFATEISTCWAAAAIAVDFLWLVLSLYRYGPLPLGLYIVYGMHGVKCKPTNFSHFVMLPSDWWLAIFEFHDVMILDT